MLGCDHSTPFTPPGPAEQGPFGTTLPRRLTFYGGMDATPSVAGDTLVFSRQSDREAGSYTAAGRERCIAFMPVEGGSIWRLLCPHVLIPQPDTFVDTWLEPVLSPDRTRLAFVWQRGLRVSAIGFADVFLMVTPVDRPADTTGLRHLVRWVQTGGNQNPLHGTMATRITWEDVSHILYLATYEHIRKVKGGGAERVTDTTYDPLALMRLDLATGTSALVPGGDSVIAYVPVPGGGVWVAKEYDNGLVRHLDLTTGVLTPAFTFSTPIVELIEVAGMPVAIWRDSTAVEWVEPGGGLQRYSAFGGLLHRLAAAGGRRFVVEVEDGTALFGSTPDLWLLEIP